MQVQIPERQDLMPTAYDIQRQGTDRLYDWEPLERISRCHPSAPLFVFVPVIFALLYHSVAYAGLGGTTILLAVLTGLLIWTFSEYWLHRFFFHLTGESQALQTFHRRIHGIHHEFPNDMTRVVFPPSASIPLALIFWFMILGLFGSEMAPPIFAGFATGYLWYDMTHWYTHAAKPKSRWGKMVREHHMRHHFKSPDRLFGVSSPVWDWVFRTR